MFLAPVLLTITTMTGPLPTAPAAPPPAAYYRGEDLAVVGIACEFIPERVQDPDSKTPKPVLLVACTAVFLGDGPNKMTPLGTASVLVEPTPVGSFNKADVDAAAAGALLRLLLPLAQTPQSI